MHCRELRIINKINFTVSRTKCTYRPIRLLERDWPNLWSGTVIDHPSANRYIYTLNLSTVPQSSPSFYPHNMEYFRSFLRTIGLLQPPKVDFISELPLEVSQLILRKLDPKSLLSVAQVSRRWLDTCCSDRTLRRTAKHCKQSLEKRIQERFVGDKFSSGLRIARREKARHSLQVQKIVPRVRIDASVAFRRLPRRHPIIIKDKVGVSNRCSRYIRI